MKQLLSILCLLMFGSVQAQYFQNQNGTGAYDEAYDGTTVVAGGQGNLIAGITQALGGTDLLLTRTNVNGTIGGINTFNQIYRLLAPGNIQLNAIPVKILQVASGRICVVGSYTTATSPVVPGIFTAVLSSAGAVISVRGWQTVTPAVSTAIAATSACRALATTSNTVFISGYSDATVGSPNGVRPLIMAINGSTNTLIWGLIHDFLPLNTPAKLLPNDLVASPYQPAGVAEVFIVGTYYDGNGPDEGFTYRVNAANGNPVGTATTFDSGRNDDFAAVCVATGTGGGANGFVITGSSNVNGNWDAITFKTDAVGSGASWITLQDYSNGGDNFGTDIIERQNTFGQWFYYAAGTATNGLLGGSDMAVFLVDDVNGTAPREFTYGTASSERAAEISRFAAAPADGITVFGNGPGTTAIDPGGEYYVKAYYNGVSGCNEFVNPPVTMQYPISRISRQISRAGTVGATVFSSVLSTLSPAVNSLCFNVVIGTGSNARIAENTENSVSSELYPNPVSLTSSIINLNLNSASEQQVEIRITDMLGREVLNQTIVVTEGESLQQIQLPSGLSAGVYNMNITGNGVNENHRFVME
ncbi:MAG: T9SS type A sorting domain-containing protein [Bacteroidia bacterium]